MPKGRGHVGPSRPVLKGPGWPAISRTGSRRVVLMGRGQTGQRRPVTKGPGRPAIGRTGSRRVVPKGHGQTNLGWREGGREEGKREKEGGRRGRII